MKNPPILVLFPGAWGNRTQALAAWWLRHVIRHFRDDYDIVVVTYEGNSLDQYVDFAIAQLKEVPDESLALCYSMGAQIARGVAVQRPRLFKRVAFFSGVECIGVRLSVFLRALTFMLVPMLRTLMGQPLKLDTVEQVKRIFYHPFQVQTHGTDERQFGSKQHELAEDLLTHRLIPEPAWAMLRLFLPGLRQRFPPIPCPVMAIVPRDDFILSRARYPGEQVHRVDTSGDHSLVLSNTATIYLHRVTEWFLLT